MSDNEDQTNKNQSSQKVETFKFKENIEKDVANEAL